MCKPLPPASFTRTLHTIAPGELSRCSLQLFVIFHPIGSAPGNSGYAQGVFFEGSVAREVYSAVVGRFRFFNGSAARAGFGDRFFAGAASSAASPVYGDRGFGRHARW